jgi:hypothetical protein
MTEESVLSLCWWPSLPSVRLEGEADYSLRLTLLNRK